MNSIKDSLSEISRKYRFVVDEMINNKNYGLNYTIKLSLKILNDIKDILQDEVIYVMFSGGKDSLVLLDLVLKVFPAELVKVVFIEVTENTHEKNVKYVHKIINDYYNIPRGNFIHLRRDVGFYDLVTMYGWPGPRRRWCMTEYKKRVINSYFKKTHEHKPVVLVGTKAGDSSKRASKIKLDGIFLNRDWGCYTVRPIIHFSTKQIYEYIRMNNIPICELYYELGESGNCIYCPFIQRRDYYLKLYKLYPEWIYKMIRTEIMVRKGKPFLRGSKKISFRDILGHKIYNSIVKEHL